MNLRTQGMNLHQMEQMQQMMVDTTTPAPSLIMQAITPTTAGPYHPPSMLADVEATPRTISMQNEYRDMIQARQGAAGQ